jgi:hypothetical protein
MIVACPACRQQLTVDPTLGGKQVQCPRCKQAMTVTISPSPPPAANPVRASTPAPVFEMVPRFDAAMRLTVEMSCVVELEDLAVKEPETPSPVRWREAIRQVVFQVERPATGSVDLPMTCSCCGKKLTLRIRSVPAVQDRFLWMLLGGGTATFLFAVLTFIMGTPTAFVAVICLLLALAGLAAISAGVWLAINRPMRFDSLRQAVAIASDSKRDEEMQRFQGVNQHALMSVSRTDRPAP